MSQVKSRRDGVFGSASFRHLPGTVTSNQEQHSKFEISDTSQSSPKKGFNQNDIFPKSSAVNCALRKLELRENNGDPIDWPERSGMFLSTVDRSTISDDKKWRIKNAVNWAGKRSAGRYVLFECYVRCSLQNTISRT